MEERKLLQAIQDLDDSQDRLRRVQMTLFENQEENLEFLKEHFIFRELSDALRSLDHAKNYLLLETYREVR